VVLKKLLKGVVLFWHWYS